jgi:hypothetical protein
MVFRYCKVDFIVLAPSLASCSFASSSHTTSPANGRRTSGNVWKNSHPKCGFRKRLRLTWQSLDGISMATVSHVGTISTSVIWRGLRELLARTSRQFGRAQIHWPQAFAKWVQQHGTTPSTTIGMDGIFVRSSDFVRFILSSFVHRILNNISRYLTSKTFQRSDRDERQAERHLQPVICDVFFRNHQ